MEHSSSDLLNSSPLPSLCLAENEEDWIVDSLQEVQKVKLDIKQGGNEKE
ncbi:hypothetical protein LguiB_001506 [Lonicera macranthoides]